MAELKPCPFCGGDAELDTRQGYSQFPNGRLGSRIAVYCRDCGADIGVCREDVPDIEPEQVVEMWNRRGVATQEHTGRGEATLSDDQILHIWDCHVNDPSAKYPLTDVDKVTFARAVLAAATVAAPAEGQPSTAGVAPTDGGQQ